MSRLWMITYDIQDHGIRKKVHDILNDHGERVQYSVFECHLSRNDLEALRRRVASLIEEKDSVRWYPFCTWCKAEIACQGEPRFTEDKDFFII